MISNLLPILQLLLSPTSLAVAFLFFLVSLTVMQSLFTPREVLGVALKAWAIGFTLMLLGHLLHHIIAIPHLLTVPEVIAFGLAWPATLLALGQMWMRVNVPLSPVMLGVIALVPAVAFFFVPGVLFILFAIAALGLLIQALERFITLRKGFALMAGALLAIFVLVVVPITVVAAGSAAIQQAQAAEQARVEAKYRQRANDDIADIHQQKLQSCIALHPSQQSQCETVQNRYVEACQVRAASMDGMSQQQRRLLCERTFDPYDPSKQMAWE